MPRTIYQVLLDLEAAQDTLIKAVAQNNSQALALAEMLSEQITALSAKIGDLTDAPAKPAVSLDLVPREED